MQSSTNPPDSPTLSDSSKKKTNSKRPKASVACHECRKRKVKCEGVQPCGRCRKSNFRCIFPQQQSSKRGPPKQYIEILEARLQLMEKALRTIGGPAREILDDALSLDPHALQDKNGIQEDDATIQQPNEFHATSIQRLPDQYTMNEIGQPYYTHDIYHHQQLKRQPSDLSLSTKSEPTTPVPSTHHFTDIDTALIDKYFEHVHPYTPMIHKSTFNQQMMNPNNPPPMLLLYSMCAVAARWSTSTSPYYSTHSNEPPGFSYYQRAFVLIDEASVAPRITTIQALVLLTKYQEHYKRAGYFYRPGYYLALAVDMCYALKLSTVVPPTGGAMETYDYETRKRTFWMTFLYDLWTSIEEGRETRFTSSQCSTDYPSSSGDDGPGTEDMVTRHNVVIRLGRTLSDIYGFSRRLASRQQVQGTVRTSSQQMEEKGRLVIMQTTLETYLREISVIPPFEYIPSTAEIGSYPVDTTNATISDAFVGFLHMMYHYSIILLHRHHVLYPITNYSNDSNSDDLVNAHPYPHQQLCATSASIINSIAESIMESNSLDVFHYPIRGVQFTILCVTMAIAVHKFEMETTQDESRKSNANTLYWQALSIINRLSSETSAVELRYLAKDAELAEMCGKLAMDSNNNGTQSTLQQQPLSPGSSSFTTTTTNNDGSSTSSSPILSSSVISTSTGSVADRINRPTKLVKPRRGTVSGSHPIKRFPSQIFAPDSHHHHHHQHQHHQHHHQASVTTSPTTPTTMVSSPMNTGQQSPSAQQQHSPLGSSSTVNPAALFNSSASITDPARLASMMQFGTIPSTSYNHHQQPLQLPTHLNNVSSPHYQPQPQQQVLRRTPRPLHHHYSHSQEDLRSLNHRHMSKTGYARAASPGTPLEGRLKKHRSMKFLPMHSQQLQHTVRQYPPPSSLQQQQTHHGQIHQVHHPQQQPLQQNLNQGYQHQYHHVQTQPLYAQHQHLQQSSNHHYPSSQSAQQPESHQYSSQDYSQQGGMVQQMNFPTMTSSGSALQRRHTISFTGMDGFISPMATMDYTSPNSSMMQLDTMDQPFRQDFTLPTTSSPSSPSSQQQQQQSSYAPMMEDDPQMMLMDPNAMHHLLADSTLSWGNGSLDMDRKAEGHVLQ